MTEPESRVAGVVRRFSRSVVVGAVATAVDVGSLFFLVDVIGFAPVVANVPSLLAGAVVQFVGCRYFVFDGDGRSLLRQVLGYGAVEIGTLLLNGVAFHVLVSWTPTPYALARPVGTFLVFALFSYPAWSRVFAPAMRAGRPCDRARP